MDTSKIEVSDRRSLTNPMSLTEVIDRQLSTNKPVTVRMAVSEEERREYDNENYESLRDRKECVIVKGCVRKIKKSEESLFVPVEFRPVLVFITESDQGLKMEIEEEVNNL